ncbi:MAG: tetratricopeptide repeat protein, partial [Casimicrobium sp.]
MCSIANANGKPYIPVSDSTPLVRLASSASSAREAQADATLRSLLKRNQNNLDVAIRVAQRFVARARSESDPRLLGQAQATLAPWWSLAEPPIPVLLLRATIRQSNHDFSNARRDLEQAVQRDSNNAQAWLTLATVQQVTADFDAATQSCKQLASLVEPLVATACMAVIDGARGRAQSAFEALDSVLATSKVSSSVNPVVRSWALTLQAELAERLGRENAADRLFRASLAIDPADAYTLAMYADFLIDAGRAREVLTLIPNDTRADILLLRRGVAAKL